jgi:hypothetical protein
MAGVNVRESVRVMDRVRVRRNVMDRVRVDVIANS